MKREMDLIRLILLEIEEKYRSTTLFNISVDGYDKETVAYHCKILFDAGLISDYKPIYGGDELYAFSVSSLTWDGNDYLEKIRDNSQWKKVKDIITSKGLPVIIDTVKAVANALIVASVEGITNSIRNGNM